MAFRRSAKGPPQSVGVGIVPMRLYHSDLGDLDNDSLLLLKKTLFGS